MAQAGKKGSHYCTEINKRSFLMAGWPRRITLVAMTSLTRASIHWLALLLRWGEQRLCLAEKAVCCGVTGASTSFLLKIVILKTSKLGQERHRPHVLTGVNCWSFWCGLLVHWRLDYIPLSQKRVETNTEQPVMTLKSHYIWEPTPWSLFCPCTLIFLMFLKKYHHIHHWVSFL